MSAVFSLAENVSLFFLSAKFGTFHAFFEPQLVGCMQFCCSSKNFKNFGMKRADFNLLLIK